MHRFPLARIDDSGVCRATRFLLVRAESPEGVAANVVRGTLRIRALNSPFRVVLGDGAVSGRDAGRAETPPTPGRVRQPCRSACHATPGARFHPFSLIACANSVPASASPTMPSPISITQARVNAAPSRPRITPYGTHDRIHKI